jgi:RHS repeat-associated protein
MAASREREWCSDHYTAEVLSQNNYYPLGLAMSGISSQALSFGQPENKHKFNDGTELESKEFSDGSGLELYATDFRSYDPQIGRFHQIDPLAEVMDNWSPYVFVHNNPLLYNDPLGLDTNKVDVPIPANVQPGQVINVNTPNGGSSSYIYDPTNPEADENGLVANGMVGPKLETVTVTGGQKKSVTTILLIGAPQHVDNFDGFWGKVDYYLNGGNVGNGHYGPDGNLRGPALLTGTAPDFSKGKLIHFGKIAVNAIKFHRVIKPRILKAAKQVFDFTKTVGKNPDVLVEGEKIILKGTGPFKGKTFDTGLNPKDFF